MILIHRGMPTYIQFF